MRAFFVSFISLVMYFELFMGLFASVYAYNLLVRYWKKEELFKSKEEFEAFIRILLPDCSSSELRSVFFLI